MIIFDEVLIYRKREYRLDEIFKKIFPDQAQMKIHEFPDHVIPFFWKKSIKKVSGKSNYFWMFLGSNRPVSIWPSVYVMSSSFDVLPILNILQLTIFAL